MDNLIYSYTDEQAVDDGILVNISCLEITLCRKSLNRMTRHLWDELEPFCRELDLTTGGQIPGMYLPELKKTLKTKISMIGLGDKQPSDPRIIQLPPNLWAVENELGGYTLMFPEDY